MFQRITIHMSAHLCSCEKRDYSWGIRTDHGRYGLAVKCKVCGMEPLVPPTKVVARFDVPDPAVVISESENDTAAGSEEE